MMFNPFKARKIFHNLNHSRAEKAASSISDAYHKVQNKWAAFLSSYEQQLTLKQKKIALVFYCLAMTILTMGYLYKGLFEKKNNSGNCLKQPSVILPQDIQLPDSLNLDYLKEVRKRKNRKDSTHQ